MKRFRIASVCAVLISWSVAVQAAESATSAGAASHGGRSGSASATAQYEGDVGFARTNTESGRMNASRAIAVGVDEDGLSLSISQAIAPRFGPAIATNFNLAIDSDGDVSASRGVAIAEGSTQRDVTAGGASRNDGGASSTARGSSGSGGRVRVHSEAHDRPAPHGTIRIFRPGELDRTVAVRTVVTDDVRRVRIVRR